MYHLFDKNKYKGATTYELNPKGIDVRAFTQNIWNPILKQKSAPTIICGQCFAERVIAENNCTIGGSARVGIQNKYLKYSDRGDNPDPFEFHIIQGIICLPGIIEGALKKEKRWCPMLFCLTPLDTRKRSLRCSNKDLKTSSKKKNAAKEKNVEILRKKFLKQSLNRDPNNRFAFTTWWKAFNEGKWKTSGRGTGTIIWPSFWAEIEATLGYPRGSLDKRINQQFGKCQLGDCRNSIVF